MSQVANERQTTNGSRPPRSKCRIVTFYSYKGGTGRSMAVANVAWVLAVNGNRVLVVDWDLEAPGIHRYFHPFLEDKELQTTPGLLDMVENLAAHAAASDGPVAQEQVNIIDYIEPLEWPRTSSISWKTFGPRARIDLLPAGRQGPAYSRKLASFNWIDFFERLGGRRLLAATREQMRGIYDYVLIDSRTGVSDTSGICTVEMPDILVVCFTLNDQSIRGAVAVANSVREQRRARGSIDGADSTGASDRDQFRIIPVPTRVEITSERDKRESALDLARDTFATFLADMTEDERSKHWGGVQMAYFPFYAFEEIPAVFGDKPDEVLSLTTAILHITRAITDPPIDSLRPLANEFATAEAARKEILTWYLRPSKRLATDLAHVAQEIYERCDEAAKADMLRVLLRLVDVGSYSGAPVNARTAAVLEFDDSVRQMVGTLIERRLLTMIHTNGERSIALTDPAVLQKWDPLRERIASESIFLRRRLSLSASAASWERSGRDESALLRGKILDDAVQLVDERESDLGAADRQYVAESNRASARRLEEEMRERARVGSLESLAKRQNSKYTSVPLLVTAIAIVAAVMMTFYLYQTQANSDQQALMRAKQEALMRDIADSNAQLKDELADARKRLAMETAGAPHQAYETKNYYFYATSGPKGLDGAIGQKWNWGDVSGKNQDQWVATAKQRYCPSADKVVGSVIRTQPGNCCGNVQYGITCTFVK